MTWRTARVSGHTHELLLELVAATGEPLGRMIERAPWESTLADGLDAW